MRCLLRLAIAGMILGLASLQGGEQSGEGSFEHISASDFLGFIATSRSQFRTVHFTYKESWSNEEEPPFLSTKGKWWWRHDGFARLETESIDGNGVKTSRRSTRTPDDLTEEVDSRHAVRRPPSNRWEGEDSLLGNFFLLRKDFLSARQHVLASFENHGWETVDGRRYLKVSYNPAPTSRSAYLLTYLIDVERGGHPVRRERTRDGERLQLIQIRLAKVGDWWFPVWARLDGRESHAELEVDPGSIEINGAMPSNAFELSMTKGTSVQDQITGKHYYVGGVRPTATHAALNNEQIDDVVSKADDQRDRIEASSSARSPYRHWLYWFFGGISLSAVVGAVLVLRRQ